VTTIRIVHAEPRPGRLANGGFQTRGHLVVLADDAGHRAVPIWMRGDPGAGDLSHLLELAGRPADQVIAADVPQELTTRLLGAARARVTGVDIDVTEADAAELSLAVTVARIGLAGPAGTRQVTADLGLGLALAVAAGAPVRLADAVMNRLAVPVPGDDLLTPFLDRVPPVARAGPGHGLPGWPMATLPGRRPRYEPRNLDFAAGLDRWDLDAGPVPAPDSEPDYAAAVEASSAVLSSSVPQPAGSAALVERHQPMVRARARQLAADPGDVDDIVQESFLQAFLALDRLRDPDRFAGWLAGIVLNVCRSLHRRAPVTLLADWPEPLHPTSAGGLPSAEDLDRADALRAAVAELPAGQLAQEIFADDYREAAVTFRGQFRTPEGTGPAGLFLRVMKPRDLHGPFTAQAALADPANHVVTLEGPGDWTIREVTAPIPDDANTVAFGLFLNGPGRIELRDPQFTARR
jgi:DNA-directed RNA polymerase specialized sigma24 family protein